jgi:pantoate--beta-alanine ligase
MIIESTFPALRSRLEEFNQKHLSIGFVPTMGALHEGHMSLLEKACSENEAVVVSIFVNPKQFNDKEDLKKYPRTLEKDIELLANKGCSLVFTPSEETMYFDDFNLEYDLGYLDQVMEGKHRINHFKGVVTIVYRLFDWIKPHRAYFGEKDFQQLAIIRKMTRDFSLPVTIVPCPIIRETDGLAMSSRNALLTPEHRRHAPLIAQTLFQARELKKTKSVQEVIQWVVDSINHDPLLEVEYFELVDSNTLLPVTTWKNPNPLRGCIAVKAGSIRLIDNMDFYS